MSRQIIVSDDDYKKFHAALMLTGEEADVVLSKLIRDYAHSVFSKAMDKYEPANTTNSTLESVKTRTSSISAEEQKKLFVTWFRGLTRNGKAYNPVTISGYTGRIENACNDPTFSSVPVNNLFDITDLTEFLMIQKQIKNCDGYMAFDAKSHNGFTAALRKYEEFLRFQTNDMPIRTPLTNTRTSSQTTPTHRWTMAEDLICCKRFLETYVIQQKDTDTVQFLQMLVKEVPEVSEGSLRMKIQNIKFLATEEGIEDTSTITSLRQYSMQCKNAFYQTLNELNLR